LTIPSFGNFVNRALKFISSQYGETIPEGDTLGPFSLNDETDSEFVTDTNGLLKDYAEAMDSVKLRLGLQTIMLISQRGNLYLQSSGLGKALMTENPTRCAQVVTRATNLIYVLSALTCPFMPSTSASILSRVNAPVLTFFQSIFCRDTTSVLQNTCSRRPTRRWQTSGAVAELKKSKPELAALSK